MKLVKELGDEHEGNQMSLISDTDEIIKFLEFAAKKSILPEHTVHCRMTACNNLFSILNEGEDNLDYMLENLDVLINRFRNKNNSVQESTLKVYKSRLKSSLEDYQSWSKDPIAWEKSIHDKSKANVVKDRQKTKAAPAPKARRQAAPQEPEMEPAPRKATTSAQNARKLSFPIRNDFNLEIVIPAEGLSLKELMRLGLFLYPYCKDVDQRDESNNAWSLVPRVTN